MSATPVVADRPAPGASPIARSRLGVVAGVPAVMLLLVVAVSTALRATLGLQVASPWILPDEIVYSELAKSIADGSRPSIRDIPTFGWGEIYPTLIAPAWILFDNGFWAYRTALVINALLMSSAAVPAYYLARMFVTSRASTVVAAMTVVIPSMSYTGVVMTENACYPIFVLALWLMTRAIRHPTGGSQALAILSLGLLALTRIQGLALVGAYVLGIATYALIGKPAVRWAYLNRFVPSVALGLAAPLAIVLLSVARGEGPFGWLGARSGTFDSLRPSEVPEWFAYLAAGLVLYVAVIPAAATVLMILRGCVRGASEESRLFAAISLPTFFAMLGSIALVSASLDVDGTENLNERYVFYVVPVMFVGLALWVREELPRGAPAFIVAVACCVAVVLLPIERLEYNASFQSVALIPWMGLRVSGFGLTIFVAAFAAAAAALWLTVPANRVGRLWLFTAAAMAVTGALTVVSNLNSASNSASAFRGQAATWVDDALPGGEQVAVLWGERPSATETPRRWYFWVMVTEFFNSSVGDVYRFGRPTYHEGFLPTRPVSLAADGTLVGIGGQGVSARYALVACQTRVEGIAVARAPRGALEVVKVDRPLRLAQPRRCARSAP